MTYFTKSDHLAVLSTQADSAQGNVALERIHKQMTQLHRELYPRLKKDSINLHPDSTVPAGVNLKTAATSFRSDVMTLTYMRSKAEAETAERLMGRDGLEIAHEIESHRHPVIEVRITPDNFVVELMMSPDAWCDQRNFVGKISIPQHRSRLYELFSDLKGDYKIGFWSGTHLSETHLTTTKLPPAHIFAEYFTTFAAGRDWFRMGSWFEPEADALSEDSIVATIYQNIRELYTIYDFLLWSGQNNFHTFYRKAVAK
jgi:hypothetical protein